MKMTILIAVGAGALALAGCSETGRRGYGGGSGYERSSTVVIDSGRGGYRRDWDRGDRRDWARERRVAEARRDRRQDRREDAREERREDRRDRREDRRDDRRY